MECRAKKRNDRHMKIKSTIHLSSLVVMVVIVAGALRLLGGHPGPARRLPAEQRQANMLMLRFQDALAAERWQEALGLCSDRVRASAAEFPTPKAFFSTTMPIENVLAERFGCWSCGTNFYGLFVTLSEPGAEPRIDWYWGLVPAGGGWVVDYPPAELGAYVAKKRAAFHERDERIKQIRQSLRPKVRQVETRLTPLSERFVIGSPMLLRLELVNSGETSIHYIDQGVRFKPLNVLNDRKEPILYLPKPAQIMLGKAELAAGSLAVLAEKIDINQDHEISKAGKYFVQFDSADLQIGQPLPHEEFGRFGENLSMSVSDFLPATNKFPSNIIEIQVQR